MKYLDIMEHIEHFESFTTDIIQYL